MTKKETIKALLTGQNMSSSKKGLGVPFDFDPSASIEQNLKPTPQFKDSYSSSGDPELDDWAGKVNQLLDSQGCGFIMRKISELENVHFVDVIFRDDDSTEVVLGHIKYLIDNIDTNRQKNLKSSVSEITDFFGPLLKCLNSNPAIPNKSPNRF